MVSIEQMAQWINPYILKHYPVEGMVESRVFTPQCLLSPQRFDLAAKTPYVQHLLWGVQSDWALRLYDAHLYAFNGYVEGDGSGKQGRKQFLDAFHDIIRSMGKAGFNDGLSLLPIGGDMTLLDGAHRLAAAICLNTPVTGLLLNNSSNAYDYSFFMRRALAPEWLDAMAMEFCRLIEDMRIVTLFPSAVGKDDDVERILKNSGSIYYHKDVSLNTSGAVHLIRQMYLGEPWVGDYESRYPGACQKAKACFNREGPVRVYVFKPHEGQDLSLVKDAVRALYGIGKHSVHINDTHKETLMLAGLFLNKNSIHFMNHAPVQAGRNFSNLFTLYKQAVTSKGIQSDFFCLDGSSVLAAYGLRDARDVDFLHFGYKEVLVGHHAITSHNDHAHYYPCSRDTLIFDPACHFYYEGCKMVSLDMLAQMKARRGEAKDIRDISLCRRLLDRKTGVASTTVSQTMVKSGPKKRLIGLVPMRNEAARIGTCLRQLAHYTDAIVLLDDASEDQSVAVAESMADVCGLECILKKEKAWNRDEPGDRNALLDAGRKLGGTHFIMIDADEVFTSNCVHQNVLRTVILNLVPGDQLQLMWFQLWRSVWQFRLDQSVWSSKCKSIAFADDGVGAYRSDFIHTARVPMDMKGNVIRMDGLSHGLMHFSFANWRNMLIKQAWYRCLERIHWPDKPMPIINRAYAPSKDETGLGLKDVPMEWYTHYQDFNSSVSWKRISGVKNR